MFSNCIINNAVIFAENPTAKLPGWIIFIIVSIHTINGITV